MGVLTLNIEGERLVVDTILKSLKTQKNIIIKVKKLNERLKVLTLPLNAPGWMWRGCGIKGNWPWKRCVFPRKGLKESLNGSRNCAGFYPPMVCWLLVVGMLVPMTGGETLPGEK
jgi:hypothetical protein